MELDGRRVGVGVLVVRSRLASDLRVVGSRPAACLRLVGVLLRVVVVLGERAGGRRVRLVHVAVRAGAEHADRERLVRRGDLRRRRVCVGVLLARWPPDRRPVCSRSQSRRPSGTGRRSASCRCRWRRRRPQSWCSTASRHRSSRGSERGCRTSGSSPRPGRRRRCRRPAVRSQRTGRRPVRRPGSDSSAAACPTPKHSASVAVTRSVQSRFIESLLLPEDVSWNRRSTADGSEGALAGRVGNAPPVPGRPRRTLECDAPGQVEHRCDERQGEEDREAAAGRSADAGRRGAGACRRRRGRLRLGRHPRSASSAGRASPYAGRAAWRWMRLCPPRPGSRRPRRVSRRRRAARPGGGARRRRRSRRGAWGRSPSGSQPSGRCSAPVRCRSRARRPTGHSAGAPAASCAVSVSVGVSTTIEGIVDTDGRRRHGDRRSRHRHRGELDRRQRDGARAGRDRNGRLRHGTVVAGARKPNRHIRIRWAILILSFGVILIGISRRSSRSTSTSSGTILPQNRSVIPPE